MIYLCGCKKTKAYPLKLLVKTICGAEHLLRRELETLGATNVDIQRRVVSCEADQKTLYKINLWSRLALRVLVPVAEFKAETDKDIYDNIYALPWHEMLSPSITFLIDHVSFSAAFSNSQFLAYKAKDAIVDKIRDQKGSRPSINTENPDVMLNIHATDDLITLSLDASVQALSKRGYRSQILPTATNEVLAAALVDLSGWTPDQTLIDPICGSGTICIEAAMKARNIAANLFRKESYGFQHWLDYDEKMWNELIEEAKSLRNNMRLTILGSDVDTDSLDIARLSTLELSLSPDVRIQRKSLRELTRVTESGVIVTCLPSEGENFRRGLPDFYKETTYYLSRNFPDHDAWLFTTNLKAMRSIEFRSEKKYEIYSGSTEGNFCLYPF